MGTTDRDNSLWAVDLEGVDLDAIEAYDYELDERLIAAEPTERRDESKLLVFSGSQGHIEHHRFDSLPDRLRRGDLLVFNDTRVVPARVTVYKETGGRVELFVLQPEGDSRPEAWLKESEGRLYLECMTRSSKPVREHSVLTDPERRRLPDMEVVSVQPGRATVAVDWPESALDFLERFGEVPLPPYIVKKRKKSGAAPVSPTDRSRYQTVYARRHGAVAAPTAGLHFSQQLLGELESRGVERADVTLIVGPGTFQPVRSERLSKHEMHREKYYASTELGEAVERCRARRGRVIAVGTTSARALEAEARRETSFSSRWRSTNLFLKPGSEFRICDALITNFHLPRSTLLALVAAAAGYEGMRKIYEEAVKHRYRFYSYGDACLIFRN